jgi:mono/diheme cytochrome c family protein
MSWRSFAAGFLTAIVLVAVGAYIYFAFGLAPVATAASPMPFEKFLARLALHTAMAKTADRPSPVDASEPNLNHGATEYREHCAVCHGLPGQEKSSIAKGMFPEPPQLFHGKGVTDDPVGETFWKIQNGIRLSGMPAFQGSLTDQEMWQISQLLRTADKLPESVKENLSRAQ